MVFFINFNLRDNVEKAHEKTDKNEWKPYRDTEVSLANFSSFLALIISPASLISASIRFFVSIPSTRFSCKMKTKI